jgi:hypothetical protein
MLNIKKWLLPKRPILSLRRLFSLMYLLLKRLLKADISFNPPKIQKFETIDVFMPTIEKDSFMLENSIKSVLKYSLNPIANVYIIGPAKSNNLKKIAKKLNCIYVEEESVFSFKKESINYFYKGYSRNGWIFKMLLNLYSDKISASKNILILDSDTVFISPQIFVYKQKPLFNLSDEYHEPYYYANLRILGVKHKISRSYITHYMLFNSDALKELRMFIEKKHNCKWYEAIIKNIYRQSGSGFADYEIYGDFYTQIYKKPYILNYWSNKSLTIGNKLQLNDIIKKYRMQYRSVSLHHYKENF